MYLGSKENDGSNVSLDTLCFLPSALLPRTSNRVSGTDLRNVNQEVKFLQVWILTSDLGLGSTLFAVHSAAPEGGVEPWPAITAPKTRVRVSTRRMGPRTVKDSFVVPDGFGEEESLGQLHPKVSARGDLVQGNAHDDLRFRLDWRKLFEEVFSQAEAYRKQAKPGAEAPNIFPEMAELLSRASNQVLEAINTGILAKRTL